MTTTELPPGLYYIAVAGGVEPARLTRTGEHVTILPPSVQAESNQKWRVAHGNDGNIIIETPSERFPTPFLTYKGAPQKPEEHDRILIRISDFPLNEWHLTIAPGFRSLIRVAGSELGIKIGPEMIYPPFLELGNNDQLQWVFERVRDE